MRSVVADISLIDVRFQGHARYIACYVLPTSAGLVLVDPGPGSTLATLESALGAAGQGLGDVAAILLTHIHLDHAGASGSIVERNPRVQVYVHERGAPHMIDPERLLRSATRLYGERMGTLWGDFLPVPAGNLHALAGGERLELGGRRLDVAYTPGHASHHVSFFEAETGVAWPGDTAGVRIDNAPWVMPVTPPPDIDVPAWLESLATLRAWEPEWLCPTHFGPATPVAEHLDEHESRLLEWQRQVEASLASNGDVEDRSDGDDELAGRFRARQRRALEAALSPEVAKTYLRGGGLGDSWRGLARHIRKRDEA